VMVLESALVISQSNRSLSILINSAIQLFLK
jgi:hypothetical protein